MSQNLLIPKADSADIHSCCLLQYVYLGFWFERYQCFPPLKLLFVSRVEQSHEQVRYFNAIN
jgi:hypothetical protein